MDTVLKGGTVGDFVHKLRLLRSQAIQFHPNENIDPQDISAYFEDDYLETQIKDLYERAILVFERFDISKAGQKLTEILERHKNNMLFIIDEPPWFAGEYLLIRELLDVIDNYLFTYSNQEVDLKTHSISRQLLLNILANIEKTFTVSNKYPENEEDLQRIVESILICSFPKLVRKPAIAKPIKNYIPDTGIPEARALIEYKFITKKTQVSIMADQIFADFGGYKHPDWDFIIYIFYETERFVPEDRWKDQLKDLKNTSVFVMKGIPLAK